MRVSELARAAGVTPETVRHYVRVGLLEAERDPANGYRRFAPSQLARLRFVRAARSLGFGVEDVCEIFGQAGAGASPRPLIRKRARERLAEVRPRIAELDGQRRRLERVLELREGLPDGMPEGRGLCLLIERAAEEMPGDPDAPRPVSCTQVAGWWRAARRSGVVVDAVLGQRGARDAFLDLWAGRPGSASGCSGPSVSATRSAP